MRAPEYRTFFTVLQKSAPSWLAAIVPGVVVVLTAIGVVAFLKYKTRRVTVVVVYIVAVLMAFTLSPSGVSDMYSRARDAYTKGDYSVAEGEVTDFHPMPYSGHQMETFSVDGVPFSYSDYVVSPCFNNTTSHGGPIRAGQRVRIAYSGDCILRLEIAADGLPSAAARATAAKTAEHDWHLAQQRDPFLNRMNFGFAIAAVFLTAWWNLQPQRFMRFWAKPPYKPLTVTLFRVFFAANLVGSLWHLTDQIKSYRANASAFSAVIEIAAAWIAVMWLMVNFVEWMGRRQHLNA